MKLPPKHQRVRRLLYRIARFFFPEPWKDCGAPSQVERVASFCIRRGKFLAQTQGREHFEQLGIFQAGETLREHNSKLNFDRHASQRVRPVIQPRLKFKTERGNT